MTKLSVTLTNVPGEIPPIQTPHSHKLKGELFRILSDNLPLFWTVIPNAYFYLLINCCSVSDFSLPYLC